MKSYSLQEIVSTLQEIIKKTFPDNIINGKINKLVKAIDKDDYTSALTQLNHITTKLQVMASHQLNMPCKHCKFEENEHINSLSEVLHLKDSLYEMDMEKEELFHRTFLSIILSGSNLKQDLANYKATFKQLLTEQEEKLRTKQA